MKERKFENLDLRIPLNEVLAFYRKGWSPSGTDHKLRKDRERWQEIGVLGQVTVQDFSLQEDGSEIDYKCDSRGRVIEYDIVRPSHTTIWPLACFGIQFDDYVCSVRGGLVVGEGTSVSRPLSDHGRRFIEELLRSEGRDVSDLAVVRECVDTHGIDRVEMTGFLPPNSFKIRDPYAVCNGAVKNLCDYSESKIPRRLLLV